MGLTSGKFNDKKVVQKKLSEIATSATGIPFSIFKEMMCQHFGKLKFLESTLKLLQQFKLQMISISDEFSIFPGDFSKLSLMCTWCQKCVSYPESIARTLFIVPYAISSHLDIVLLDEDENDTSNQLETLPILFTSHGNYDKSFASFLDSLKLVAIQLEIMTKISKLSVVVLFNKIERTNFCSVKLLKLMHH